MYHHDVIIKYSPASDSFTHKFPYHGFYALP